MMLATPLIMSVALAFAHRSLSQDLNGTEGITNPKDSFSAMLGDDLHDDRQLICTNDARSTDDKRDPYLRECLNAALRIPPSGTIQSFGAEGTDAEVKLPQAARWGKCIIAVTVFGSQQSTERSSWVAIRAAASEIMLFCQKGGGRTIREARTIGTSVIGVHSGIKIEVSKGKPEKTPVTLSNGTVLPAGNALSEMHAFPGVDDSSPSVDAYEVAPTRRRR